MIGMALAKTTRTATAKLYPSEQPTEKEAMNTAIIDDNPIETRFVWARCAAKNARAMRDLIRAFQSDGWTGWAMAPRTVRTGKKVVRRKKTARR